MSSNMHMVNSFDPNARVELGKEDAELLERREGVLGSAYRLFYREPVSVVRAEGVKLFDQSGAEYLDAYNNVPVVGHSNPAVLEKVSRQLGILNTHTRYLTEPVVAYAERLLALFPSHLDRVVFACTGSEAVDLALRVARHTTGRRGVIATSHAYHGVTSAAAEISPSLEKNNPIPDDVVLVDAPDELRDTSEDAGEAFGVRVRDAIEELRRRGFEPAALILDSVLSSDGLQTRPGLLAAAAREIRAASGLYIADEVQSGFGRTGVWWGFSRHQLEPDMVVLGKPMGNGIPISALVARSEILDAFGREVRYFNTFGGNPVSIAAATAVLDELEQKKLLENAKTLGAYVAARLREIADGDSGIAAVRHAGLFLTMEFVLDAETNEPDPRRAGDIVNAMREARVLISASGRYDNVLKIRPPLVFTRENADRLLDVLETSIRATS